ncbi:hypothetical protein PINS_up015050 [Pythium insidiosum]|nr:hypothetical protein PINS_up015050 [Pythium insidiosum]
MQRIQSTYPELATCLIDPQTLHITLCVLHLDTEEEIHQAASILRERTAQVAVPVFSQHRPTFDVHGFDFFGQHNVLHACVDKTSKPAQHMAVFAKALHDAMEVPGFTTERFRMPYTPHVTIWKSWKDKKCTDQLNRGRKRGNLVQDELAAFLAEEYGSEPLHFGTETPVSVELLCMTEKDENGYYVVYETASLVDASPTGLEDSQALDGQAR